MEFTLNTEGSLRNPNEIEDLLRMEVGLMRLECGKADAEFWRISADVFALYHGHKVELAARAQCVTRISLLAALRRLNRFLSEGTIPDDLRFRPAVPDKCNAQAA